jgi:hypothetical protein
VAFWGIPLRLVTLAPSALQIEAWMRRDWKRGTANGASHMNGRSVPGSVEHQLLAVHDLAVTDAELLARAEELQAEASDFLVAHHVEERLRAAGSVVLVGTWSSALTSGIGFDDEAKTSCEEIPPARQ